MLACGKSNRSQVTYSGGQYNYDPISGEPLPPSNYVVTVTEPGQFSAVALYVMPGMRFQKNENHEISIKCQTPLLLTPFAAHPNANRERKKQSGRRTR